jgi:alkylated DNA repair dioxygenase AlkB
MLELFPNDKIILDLPEATFEYYPHFFNEERAYNLFEKLLIETPWQLDSIKIFGKTYLQPRQTALFGNLGKPYSYSNITMHPHPWNDELLAIKSAVEKESQTHFTTVLINHYRNEKDSNGWHADNEKELGKDPIIASISLGESRLFQIKHNTNPKAKLNLNLENGSLLLMKEGSQKYYKHQLPKCKSAKKDRINLTFRTIY